MRKNRKDQFDIKEELKKMTNEKKEGFHEKKKCERDVWNGIRGANETEERNGARFERGKRKKLRKERKLHKEVKKNDECNL